MFNSISQNTKKLYLRILTHIIHLKQMLIYTCVYSTAFNNKNLVFSLKGIVI